MGRQGRLYPTQDFVRQAEIYGLATRMPVWSGFPGTGRALIPAALGAVQPAAAAPVVPSVTGGRGHTRRRSRSSRMRLLAPVAVAAAVAAVIAAVLVVPRHPTTTASGHVAGPGYAEGGRVPPYFVALTWSNNTKPADAAVRLTAGGATIATVKPTAADSKIVGVIGASDDRTFILDEQSLKQQHNQVVNAEPHTFYRLRISASGRPSSVTRLPSRTTST
jgi:hypothetical protein